MTNRYLTIDLHGNAQHIASEIARVRAAHRNWMTAAGNATPIDAIVQAVARVHGFTPEELRSAARPHKLSYARFHAYWELRKRKPDMGLVAIAQALHRHDHACVINGLRHFEAAIEKRQYMHHRQVVAAKLAALNIKVTAE